MESNYSFKEKRVFDAITVIAVSAFLFFFIKSVVVLLDAFQNEVYSNALAQLGSL
jgi:hypothetical protein